MSFDEQPDSHCKCCYEWEQRDLEKESKIYELTNRLGERTRERDEAMERHQRALPAMNQDLETCRQWLLEKEKLIATAHEELQGWRKALWLSHGCPVTALYGDDGEMSCGGCLVDFKRGSIEAISELWKRHGAERLKKHVESFSTLECAPGCPACATLVRCITCRRVDSVFEGRCITCRAGG